MSVAKLGKVEFEAARTYIKSAARPLEAALFDFHFENGAADAVFEALATFQNADGGFGHGLEPDVRSPVSSVICTTIAFQILGDMPHLDESQHLGTIFENAASYLQATFDAEQLHWRIIPHAVASSPRAPWWHEGGRAEDFDAFSLNPTAEVLGLLYRYESVFPKQIITNEARTEVTKKVVQAILDSDEIEMHDLFCCLRLAASPNLSDDVAATLQQKLGQLTVGTVATDPAQWSGYGLQPLDVVHGPDSALIAGLEDAIAANLDYVISAQNKNGAWMPAWTWGDVYPEAWEQAKIEWAGVITLGKLKTLKKFGRIER